MATKISLPTDGQLTRQATTEHTQTLVLVPPPTPQGFQGAAECALAQVVGGRDQTWEGLLSGKAKAEGSASAKVIIRAQEVANSNSVVDFTLAGSNLG